MEILIAAMMGGAVAMVMFGMGMTRAAQPDALADRLDRYGNRQDPLSLEEVELQDSFYNRALKPIVQRFAAVAVHLAPGKTLEELDLKLARAGYPNGWTAADYMGVRGLGALIAGGVPFILLLYIGTGITRLVGFTALFALLGYFLPQFWLGKRIQARQKEIQNALPDALDLMTVSVEAGLAFDSALHRVASKWENELARAFDRVAQQMRVGRTRREALTDMAERIDVEEVTTFVAAVLQAEQLGGSMAKVLRIQSEQQRVRRRQRAEEQAQKAPIKMLFPMVFLIFPALFVVLLGPAVIILRDVEALGG